MNCLRLLRIVKKPIYIINKVQKAKYALQHPIRFMETQDKWRERDNIPKQWQLIYKGPMDKVLNFASTFLTVSTVAVGLGTVYYAGFVFNPEDMNTPVVFGDDVVIANSPAECLIYLGAFILLHIAVKIVLSKYVLRMYQNGDEYIAVFRGHFYNSIKKHKFHLKEFKKLRPTYVVTWGDARYDLGNKHGIIFENYFKTPEHFNYLLNKDKLFDPDNEE